MPFRERIKRIFASSPPEAHDLKAGHQPVPVPASAPGTASGTGTEAKPANTGNNGSKDRENAKSAPKPAPKPAPAPTGMSPNAGLASAQARFLGAKARTPKLDKNGNPKIELYRPSKVPPSKFKGPFDPDHMKRLADYSIPQGREDRPLSMMSELSPTATKESKPWDEIADTQEQSQWGRSERQWHDDEDVDPLEKPTAAHLESTTPGYAPDRASERTAFTHDGSGSLSSLTLVTPRTNDTKVHDPESHFQQPHNPHITAKGKGVYSPLTIPHAETHAPVLTTSELEASLNAVKARA